MKLKYTYNYFFSVLIILPVILLISQSCNTEKPKGKKIIPKEIGKIHFFLETSASMGGYFQKDAEFKTIITDLTSKIENEIKPIDIWFISDIPIKYMKSTQEFSSDIATTKIATGESSQLHKILSDIESKTDSNDISILVSDCILSFPDDAIKKDPEINKTEAPNSLKAHIYSTFSDLKKKGFGASVYAFKSKFYANAQKNIFYYDYQNSQKILNGTKRPFYIWVIADKELLAKFNSKLADITTFKPEKSLQFGLNEEPVTDYSIISQIEHKGNWQKSPEGINEIEISKTEPMQFCVALNLDNLPEYASEITYLQQNIQVENVGCEVSFEIKDKSKVDKSKLKSKPQIEMFEHSTHTIIFKVNAMALSKAQINVTLPLNYDIWYMDWSCDDDRNINSAEGKTFAFEHLITGVKEAYETRNKNYIDFSITLNK